jgi:hypothetical protein
MFRALLIAALALPLGAVAAPVPPDKSAELILGKWEGDGGSVTLTAGNAPPKTYKRTMVVTFTKDGKITMVGREIAELKAINPDLAKGETVEGTYRFTGDNEIELDMKGTDREPGEKFKAKVAVSENELSLQSMGETTIFKRVKK